MAGWLPMPNSIPTWVAGLGAPVWVSDPRGEIAYINERAERLLGVPAERVVGRPCHQVVAGLDSDGKPHCGPDCPVLSCARRDAELEPFDLCVRDREGNRHWVQVLIISIRGRGHGRPWLVHCAIPRDRTHRIEEYLSRVATRTRPRTPEPTDGGWGRLTARESEVLELLARDHSLHTIADELCISYVTVRNHVQHILGKLGAHSIVEAVARYLGHRDETGA